MPRLPLFRKERRRAHSSVAPLEALEDRVLLSTVTVSFKGGNLTVKGDAENNTVGIEDNGMGGIVVRGYDGTEINEPGETEFVIDEASIAKNAKLLFNAGGDNTVYLGVDVGGNVIYKGGKQVDNFAINDASVGKKVNVKTSDGDDLVGMQGATIGAFNANTGNDNDTIGIINSFIGGSTKLNTGNGDDVVGSAFTTFDGAVNAKTGNGDDGVFVDATFNSKTSVNLGNGDDDLIAYGTFSGPVKANGGGGENDQIDGDPSIAGQEPRGFEGLSPTDGYSDIEAAFIAAFEIWLASS
jgi:hypothetical protein